MLQTNIGKKNNWPVVWLFIIFAGPLLSAYLLFTFQKHFQFKSTCSGQLLSPPISYQNLPFYENSFLGKWQLILITKEHKTKEDTKNENITKNNTNNTKKEDPKILESIVLALGKERDRVEQRSIILKKTKDLPDHLNSYLNDNVNHLNSNQLLVIDPKGWLILYYPGLSNPKGILKDIQRLLRLSHVG